MINDVDLERLKYITNNVIQDPINGVIPIDKLRQLLELYYQYRSMDLIQQDTVEKQLNTLFLFAKVLYKYNEEELHLSYEEFNSTIYQPNILLILSDIFKDAKRTLYHILKTTYDQVKDHCNHIIEFYLVLRNTNNLILQQDVLNIFFSTQFVDNDPLDCDNLRTFYKSSFKFIYYSYLKIKTNELIDFNVDPLVIWEEYRMAISTRYKIFEEGIRLAQINELCNNTNAHDKLIKNYNTLKAHVINNELQKFYLYQINKSISNDNKMSIINTYDADSTQLREIKEVTPVVYKLIRSLHIIDIAFKIESEFKMMLYKAIYEVLYQEFSLKLSNELSINLADNISKRLTQSLTSGQYIDPITMSRINIYTSSFVREVKLFLGIMLKHARNSK